MGPLALAKNINEVFLRNIKCLKKVFLVCEASLWAFLSRIRHQKTVVSEPFGCFPLGNVYLIKLFMKLPFAFTLPWTTSLFLLPALCSQMLLGLCCSKWICTRQFLVPTCQKAFLWIHILTYFIRFWHVMFLTFSFSWWIKLARATRWYNSGLFLTSFSIYQSFRQWLYISVSATPGLWIQTLLLCTKETSCIRGWLTDLMFCIWLPLVWH